MVHVHEQKGKTDMTKEDNGTVILKVSELTGSRLINLEDFIFVKSAIAENPHMDGAALVLGFMMGRAARMNLSLQKDMEKIQDETCSVLERMGD